jgi:protein disulfide-isomerase
MKSLQLAAIFLLSVIFNTACHNQAADQAAKQPAGQPVEQSADQPVSQPVWHTDLGAAKILAKEQDRPLFVFFTGSDWCSWCIRLHEEVLSKPAFLDYASANLVLVKIDFPRRNPLPAEVLAANNALARSFEVSGFPTIIILNKDGERIGQMGYMRGGPTPFLARLRSITNP